MRILTRTTLAVFAMCGLMIAAMGPALAHDNGSKQGRCHGDSKTFDFDTLDADGDGKITEAELDAMRTSRFAETDTDGDGLLSRDEILAKIQERSSRRHERMADRMIGALDADDDDHVSLDEYSSDKRMSGAIGRLDSDSDGVISREEFDEKCARKGHKYSRWKNRDKDHE